MPTLIDNTEPGSTTTGALGEGVVGGLPTVAYFGQTFVAPGNGMRELTYYLRNGTAADTPYHLLITTIEETADGIRPGRIIKEVTGLVEPGGVDAQATAVTVDLEGTRLEKGETYAFILDTRSAWDGATDGVTVERNNLIYLDGTSFVLSGPYGPDRSSDFEFGAWDSSGLSGIFEPDFRFSATFSDEGKTITGKGKITLKGTTDDDTIVGKKGEQKIKAKAGFDTLSGGKQDDILKGGADGDVLIGGKHKDKLYGDEGYDCFVFDFKMTKKSAKKHQDKIYGFETDKDEIHLKQKYFSGLELGERPADDTTITYKNKALFYDDVKFVKFKQGAPSSLDDIDIVVVA